MESGSILLIKKSSHLQSTLFQLLLATYAIFSVLSSRLSDFALVDL